MGSPVHQSTEGPSHSLCREYRPPQIKAGVAGVLSAVFPHCSLGNLSAAVLLSGGLLTWCSPVPQLQRDVLRVDRSGSSGQHGSPLRLEQISGCAWVWNSWCQLVSDWLPGRELQCAVVSLGCRGLGRSAEKLRFLSPQVLKSIPQEEQREAALSQLNKAVLELCAEQRPTQSDLLYQTWCVAAAG